MDDKEGPMNPDNKKIELNEYGEIVGDAPVKVTTEEPPVVEEEDQPRVPGQVRANLEALRNKLDEVKPVDVDELLKK